MVFWQIIKRILLLSEPRLRAAILLSSIKEARKKGYKIILYYLYTDDVSINLKRIAYRVKQGGHSVPALDVRRRYRRSLQNLFHLYWDLCDIIAIYDVSGKALRRLP